MPSIAQTLLNKYNGVVDVVQAAVTQAADQGIAAVHKATQPKPKIIMTESQLRNKEMLRTTLKNGAWMIDFTKLDGTPTTMECTLDSSLIPPSPVSAPLQNAPRQETAEHLLAVYAIDRGGWRSFATNNVTKIYKKL
jgi:WYL_2, Sm-like SH3 beta-barrel fold